MAAIAGLLPQVSVIVSNAVSLHPVIPAISNAIHDAIGIRLTHLPFHPHTVLKKLREKRAPLPVAAAAGAQLVSNARC